MVKPRKSYRQLYSDFAPKSFCSTLVEGGSVNPEFVHIRFKGPIANIPALKNQKIKNTNILRNEAKVLFDIMTRAFQKSVNFKIPQFDPKIEVFCLILCSYRKVSFDEDNVLTSVRDWLEPSHIRKHDRGWGVGVVPNDRSISAYAIKKRKGSADPLVTEIFLRPLENVRASRDAFFAKIAGESFENKY